MTVEEERQLIVSKDLKYLKKYFKYSTLFLENEVQFVYAFGDEDVFMTYLRRHGLNNLHAQAACAKLCSKEAVKILVKECCLNRKEVEKELVSRADEELLEYYEKYNGPIIPDDE